MPLTPFGSFEGKLSHRTTVTFNNIRSGTLTAQELIMAGNGILRSANYDPLGGGWKIEGGGNAYFSGSVFAAGIAFMDVLNDNTQVGAIGGSNDELLIAGVGTKNIRIATLTGGTIQLDPGSGGATILNSDTSINGSLDVLGGGSIRFRRNSTAKITTNHNPQSGDRWIEYRANNAGAIIGMRDFGGGTQLVTSQMNVTDDGFEINAGTFEIQAGTEGAPGLAFAVDSDTGIYRFGTNAIGWSTGGSEALLSTTAMTRIARQLQLPDGDLSTLGVRFAADSDTGWYRAASNHINFVAGGSVGFFYTAGSFGSSNIGDSTTGSAANVHIQSTGSRIMFRSTSSLKYKPGWQFADEGVLASLEMPTPIVWEDENGGTMLGFGTEHVQVMLDAATQDLSDDGNPENYDVRSLVAILSAKIKRLEAQVEELQRTS